VNLIASSLLLAVVAVTGGAARTNDAALEVNPRVQAQDDAYVSGIDHTVVASHGSISPSLSSIDDFSADALCHGFTPRADDPFEQSC